MQKRVIWKMLVLSIVTLGIYRLYWFIKTRREMMDLNPNVKILSPAFLIIPVVIVVIAVVVFIATIFSSITSPSNTNCSSSNSAYSNTFNSGSSSSNNSNDCQLSGSSAVGLLALYGGIFLAYIFFVIWEWSYSHGVEAVTGGKLSFAMSLVVLILVPDGIDILIIQDSFNKLGTPAGMPPHMQPPAAPYYPQPMPPQPPYAGPPAPPQSLPPHHGEHHPHEHGPTS